jgi:hypothetical protein
MEHKYIRNIEYLNIAQLKALHHIEIDRIVKMKERYKKALPSERNKIDFQQLDMAIRIQQEMLDEIAHYINKLESFFIKT